jgi:hypothetical protein
LAEEAEVTALTVRQILDAFERALEETRRKIERGEIRQDGRFGWPDCAGAEDKITRMEKKPAISDMTPRQILDAMTRALDRVARRFAEQRPEQISGRSPHQRTE